MKLITLLGMLGILLSCSKTHYKDSTSPHTAKLSFTNLASNSAEVNIIYDCHKMPVERNRLEIRPAHKIAKHITKIQADKLISIEFRHYTIGNENSALITIGGAANHRSFSVPKITTEKNKDLDVCSSYVNFLPQKNKNYELILRSQGNKCRIDVRESVTLENAKKKELLTIKNSSNNPCR